jgi:hypothetical protein
MRSLLASSAAVILVVLQPASISAQTCMGTAPFSAGTGRIGAIAAYNERANSIGGSLSAGMQRGLFAGASFSRLSIDDADRPAPAFAATAGLGIDAPRLPSTISLQFCPFAGYESVLGPDVDLGGGIPPVTVRTHAYRGGLAIGIGLAVHETLSFVPNASMSYVSERASMRQGGSTQEVSADYRVFDYGLGVVFNRIFSAQVMASIPIGVKNVLPTIGLAFGMNFGSPEW